MEKMMLRRISKMAIMFFLPFCGFCQWSVIGGFTINKSKGVTDYNINSIINNGSVKLPLEITKYNLSTNVCFGLRKETLFNDKMGYNWELLYLGKSLKLANSNSKAFTHQILAVPVLFIYNLNNHLSFEVGPQAELLLMEKKGYIRSLNVSGSTGLIFKTSGKFGLGLRFSKSLGNTLVSNQYKLLHNTGTAYLSYKISEK